MTDDRCREEIADPDGHAVPCDKPAVGIASDDIGIYPACSEHAGPELHRLLAAVWEQGMRHESEHLATYGQFCPHCAEGKCNPYTEEGQ